MKARAMIARTMKAPDDAVAAHLKQTAAPAPLDAVDWHALHERIMADANGISHHPSAVRRLPPAWHEPARSVAMALPVGMAAGLVAALALTQLGTVTDVRPSVLAALRGDVPVATLADGLLSPDAERYIAAAVVGE
jgi:hypothetical protein